MRERNREIHRRRHRYAKRVRLRKKLAAATNDSDRQKLTKQILKTYPLNTTSIDR